jgi:DNA repair ATPase RecN
MYPWIYAKWSEFYGQLQQGVFDVKTLLLLIVVIGVIAFWKRKLWLKPIQKCFSYFTSNRKNEMQLNDAKMQLRDIYLSVSSAISDLKSKKGEFSLSIQSVKSNVDEIFSQNKRSVNLVKSRNQVELELERLTRIYGESLSDLENALENIQSNMERADQRDFERNKSVESAMKDNW